MKKKLILSTLKSKLFFTAYTLFLLLIIILTVFIYNNNETKLLIENKNHFNDKVKTLESILSKNNDITAIFSKLFKEYKLKNISDEKLSNLQSAINKSSKYNAEKDYFTFPINKQIGDYKTFNTFIGSGKGTKLNQNYLKNILTSLRLQHFQRTVHQQLNGIVASYYFNFTYPDNFISFYPYMPEVNFLSQYDSFKQFSDFSAKMNDTERRSNIIKKPTSFWSEPYLDPAGNGMMVSYNAPFYKGDTLKAIIGIDITLDFLNQYVNDTNKLVSQNYIVSPKGFVITGSNINYQKNDDLIIFDDLLTDLGGKSNFIINTHLLENAPWKLVSLIPKNNLIKQTIVESYYYNIFFLFSVFIALISYYFINKNFIIPAILSEKKLQHSNTELNQRTKELEQSLIDLENAQQKIFRAEKSASLTTLVTGISHEINTPAGIAITASSHINEKITELQQAIESNKISKTKLVNSLAQITQSEDLISANLARVCELIEKVQSISSTSHDHKLTLFNVKEYLFKVTNLYRNLIEDNNHTLNINCPNITIESYQILFDQIVFTLIDNSVQHGFKERNQGAIEITFSEQKDHYQLLFSDNGCGINEVDKAKIFDPFYTSSRGKSKGLGLYTIHNLIKETLHGDIIIADTQNDQGVCFIITWPK